MNKTFIPISKYNSKKWYIVDAKNKPLGRVATIIAKILQGKHKSDYHPSIDSGDYVIIINAQTMYLDSWSIGHPKYRVYNPGRPGSSLKLVFEKVPKRIIESSVKNMLPSGLRQTFYKRLRVYNDSKHLHKAQNPILFNSN